MKLNWFGRTTLALVSALALGLGMTACGGGTIAYIWAVGQQYNQISGYKVDDYTGNLTAIDHSPFVTNGAKPVDILVKPGGRYVYVINQGSASTSLGNSADAGISVFSVGGDGSLTYQQKYTSNGVVPTWATFDSTGTYLFVLDKYGPPTVATTSTGAGTGLTASTNGVITTFSADPNTGRLTVVTQTASTPAGGMSPTYLPVGTNPIQMASSGSCLFTVNSADQSITPYSISSGQLGTVTTGKFFPGSSNATSINGNATYMIVTDAGTSPGTSPGTIFPYTVGTACNLTTFTGGSKANDVSVSNPSYSFLDAKNQFLFVLNKSSNSTATTSAFSYITEYSIQAGELMEIPQSPFKSGSGPSCMVEDPTSKFLYVSNQNDGTITGYQFDTTQGPISDLSRGSTFTTGDTGLTCLALSGSVD